MEKPPAVQKTEKPHDPKNELDYMAMIKFGISPVYKIEGEREGEKNILVGAYLDGIQIALGIGETKRKANADAARNALAETQNLEKVPRSLLKKRGIK